MTRYGDIYPCKFRIINIINSVVGSGKLLTNYRPALSSEKTPQSCEEKRLNSEQYSKPGLNTRTDSQKSAVDCSSGL
jgi:hypothetical protein